MVIAFFYFKDKEQVLKDAKTTIEISANVYFHRGFNGIFKDIFGQLIDLLKQFVPWSMNQRKEICQMIFDSVFMQNAETSNICSFQNFCADLLKPTECFFYWSARKMTKCQTLRKF